MLRFSALIFFNLIFASSISNAQVVERVEDVYPIYAGGVRVADWNTVFIEPSNEVAGIEPNDVIVEKNCIVEIEGNLSVPAVLSGAPGDFRNFYLRASLRVLDLTNGAEFPCPERTFINDEVFVPGGSSYGIITIEGEARESRPFFSLEDFGGPVQVDYVVFSDFGLPPGEPTPAPSVLPSQVTGFISIAFIIEYVIEKADDKDIEVEENLRIAQTSYDPKLPSGQVGVVQDKPFHLEVLGNISGIEEEDSFNYRLSLVNQSTGNETVLDSAPFTGGNGPIEMFVQIPPQTTSGTYSLKYELDSENTVEEDSEDNNLGTSSTFQVVETYPLTIGIVGFDDCDSDLSCYGSSDPSSVDVYTSDETIEEFAKIFPVTSSNTKIDRIPFRYSGENTNSVLEAFGVFAYTLGIVEDFRALRALSFTLPETRKLIGVVPEDYFKYHDQDSAEDETIGIAMVEDVLATGSIALLKERQSYDDLAHELGHLFGSSHVDQRVNGFDNSTSMDLKEYNSLMAAAEISSPDFLWIPKFTYEKVLKSLTESLVDPEILIVSGLIDLESNEILESFVEYSSAGQLPSENSAGDIRIETLNSEGQAIDSIQLASSKRFFIETQGQAIEIAPRVVPFATALPANSEAIRVNIFRNNEIVAVNYYIDSFRDVVNLIEVNSVKGRKNRGKRARLRLLEKLAIFCDKIIDKLGSYSVNSWRARVAENILKFKLRLFEKQLNAILKPGENKDVVLGEFRKLKEGFN